MLRFSLSRQVGSKFQVIQTLSTEAQPIRIKIALAKASPITKLNLIKDRYLMVLRYLVFILFPD